MSMEDLFFDSTEWFPGILLIYNGESRQLLRLDTGQGDSEVVLIDETDVYYRVNTTLYKVSITANGLGESLQLVQDPIIGNVHMAFRG